MATPLCASLGAGAALVYAGNRCNTTAHTIRYLPVVYIVVFSPSDLIRSARSFDDALKEVSRTGEPQYCFVTGTLQSKTPFPALVILYRLIVWLLTVGRV